MILHNYNHFFVKMPKLPSVLTIYNLPIHVERKKIKMEKITNPRLDSLVDTCNEAAVPVDDFGKAAVHAVVVARH